MKLLITGGGGYLGTVLVRECVQQHPTLSVRVVDRFDYGTQPLLSVVAHAYPPVEVLAGDLRDRRVLADALKGVDTVIHLAGIVGYPACEATPQEADEINVGVTRALCEQLDGRRMIFASTGSCYGKVEGLCTEETPLSPLTRYGRNKRDAEVFVGDVGGLILRFATLYGLSPRMRWDLLLHDFCRRAVHHEELCVYEPHARRTFLHVADAARLIRLLLIEGTTGVYNVGDEAGNWTKGEIAAAVARLSGCRVTENTGFDPDGRDYRVSYQKLYNHVGHAAKQQGTIEQTLPQVLAWARIWR